MTDLSEMGNREISVTVVIPNWNGMKWLPGCLNAVTNQSAKPESIILVDNGSEDESVRWVSTNYSEVSIIKLDKNFGFARAVNAGIEKARTKYVALLNTDTVVDPNWLIYLWEILEQGSEKIGAVTPLMLSMQNPEIIDDAGDDLSWYGEASKSGHGLRVDGQIFSKEVFSPCAGAALYRRGFFDVCGFFDPDFFAYLEDVDIGLRGRLLGFHYLLVPQSLVYHQSHGSAINHAFYIQLVTQNRLLLFIKNIPTSRWIKFLPKIIYGQFYFLLAYGHLFASIRGYMGVIRKLPSVWSKRKDIKQAKVIEDWELDQLLKSEKPREGIRHHLRKLLKRFFH